jgi:hypothetical protein
MVGSDGGSLAADSGGCIRCSVALRASPERLVTPVAFPATRAVAAITSRHYADGLFAAEEA